MHYYGIGEGQEKKFVKYLGDNPEDLSTFNSQHMGIFWCFNMNTNQEYQGKREKSKVVDTDIKTFFIDLDEGTQDDMWIRLVESPLIPTMVIKTYRGYHAYWFTDLVTLDSFEDIQKRLIDYFGGDPKCKDVVRILRVPGFIQWKYEKPFMVEQVWRDENLYYTDRQMKDAFPVSRDYVRITESPEKTFLQSNVKEDGMLSWDRFNSMDQGELLLRLSGTDCVNRQVYTLVENSNKTKQIVVDGKTTGCFINDSGDIIADHGFSKNVFNWLRWREYNLCDKDIYDIIRYYVPEVFRR